MPESVNGISVIMPAYNSAKLIRYSIKSILNQSYKELELIIVDDGSDDNTAEVISEFKDNRILYFKTENKGTAAAVNFGVTKAKYDWIARIDTDDLNTKDRLEQQVEYINNNPETDVVSSWSIYFNNKGRILFFLLPPVEHKYILDVLNLHNPLNQSGVLIRKKMLDEYKYNESFLLNEDFELFFRIREKVKFRNIPEYLVYTRVHEKSKSFKKRNRNVYDMLMNHSFKNLVDSKSKGDHFYWACKIAWISFFYGNRKDSRSFFKTSVSLKNTLALIATFLPDKFFDKFIYSRLKYRLISLFKEKKRYYNELKELLK